MKHKGYNNGLVGRDHQYGYQEQEEQNELGLNWVSYKFRNHDPATGRFFSVDPLTEDYMDWGPYVFSGNRLIDARELEGLEPVILSLAAEKNKKLKHYSSNVVANSILNDKVKKGDLSKAEAEFLGKNPRKAYSAMDNDKIAIRFATNSRIPRDPNSPDTDDARDAIRHYLWSALNTQTSGEEFARGIGKAHEDGNFSGIMQRSMDIMNNEVGIQVAKDNPDADVFELMILLVDKLESGALYIINPDTGKLERSKLSEKDSKEVKNTAESLYNDGDNDSYDDDN